MAVQTKVFGDVHLLHSLRLLKPTGGRNLRISWELGCRDHWSASRRWGCRMSRVWSTWKIAFLPFPNHRLTAWSFTAPGSNACCTQKSFHRTAVWNCTQGMKLTSSPALCPHVFVIPLCHLPQQALQSRLLYTANTNQTTKQLSSTRLRYSPGITSLIPWNRTQVLRKMPRERKFF